MRNLFRILILALTLLVAVPYAAEVNRKKEIIKAIKEVNFDRAVIDLCVSNKKICKVLTDERIYTYLKKHHKKALFSIAFSESSFKYKYGRFDENDRGYFQVNTKVWNPEKIKKTFGIKTTNWSLTHNIKVQTEVALRIWLYNSAIYILKKRKYPKNLAQYASLYHNPNYISKSYEKKIKKVVFKVRF